MFQDCKRFRGERVRSKEDFSLRMYQDEVKEWIEEEEARRKQQAAELQEIQSQQASESGDATLRQRLDRTETMS